MSDNTPVQYQTIQAVLQDFGIDDADLTEKLFQELYPLDDDTGYLTKSEADEISNAIDAMKALAVRLGKLPNSEITNRHGDKISDLIDRLLATSAVFTEDIRDIRRQPYRPVSEAGTQRLRMYTALDESGVNSAWNCAKIIAKILVATERSSDDVKRLRDTIHQQIRNHLNK